MTSLIKSINFSELIHLSTRLSTIEGIRPLSKDYLYVNIALTLH